MVERGGGDQQVRVRDQAAAPAQEGSRLSEALHDGVVESEQPIEPEKGAEADEVSLGVRRGEGALIDLAQGDVADIDAAAGQALKCAERRLPVCERLDDPIAIQQIDQGRSSGREPASRAS